MDTDSNLTLLAVTSDSLVTADEETLIEDDRLTVRPAQRVEQKLVAALQSGPVLVSQMQKVKRPHDR
jgi:hypothetical protein